LNPALPVARKDFILSILITVLFRVLFDFAGLGGRIYF
jgi:hypothetical protein